MTAVRRIASFYRLQFGILRTWQPNRRAAVRRVLTSFLVSFIALTVTAWLLPGVTATGLGAIAAAVLALGGFNLLVRPLVLATFAALSVILVIAATLILQVASFLVVAWVVTGYEIAGWVAALVGSFVYAATSTVLGSLLALDDETSYWATLVQQLATRRADTIRTDRPGLLVVQVDGLAHPILRHQIRAGRVPFIAGQIRSGAMRLERWEALLPSQTSASQAGILHGNNSFIPAFRWWEKDRGALMVSNHPADAAEIVRRASNGEGLLSNDGASIGNLVSGDAARSYITMATIRDRSQGLGRSRTFFSFFASPNNYLDSLVRAVVEVVKEYVQATRQRRAGVVPRMHRGMPYPVARAGTNVLLRSLSTALVMEEMYRGTPVIYVDYTDYDEIAHHSGPERGETFDALDGVDAAIATLEKASAAAPRPYRFVVVSDHGQTLGATFLQRYGKTLGDVIRELMGGQAQVEEAVARVEEWGQTNAFLSELTQVGGISGGLARTALRSRTSSGVVELGPSGDEASSAEAERAPEPEAERPELIAIASGNLGLVYFPRLPGRVSVEQLAAAYPGLLDALASHPGIGAILVRSEAHGSIVVGPAGINYLAEGRVEGVDPVAQYGGRAREAVLRLDGMAHVPDLSVISLYDPVFQEVAAFEELIGSHGGLGGPQTRALMLHPADWELDEDLLGAEAVYRQIRRWAERHLGLRFGKDGSAEPLPMPERPAGEATPAA